MTRVDIATIEQAGHRMSHYRYTGVKNLRSYSREVNSFSISFSIANIFRNSMKDVTCWEQHGRERRCDDAHERAVPAGKIIDTRRRFSLWSSQQSATNIFCGIHSRQNFAYFSSYCENLLLWYCAIKKKNNVFLIFVALYMKIRQGKSLFYKVKKFQNFNSFNFYLNLWILYTHL